MIAGRIGRLGEVATISLRAIRRIGICCMKLQPRMPLIGTPAREVNDMINGLSSTNIKSDQDKVDTVSDRPKVSPPPEVDGYVAEFAASRPALPPD